jgi:hypothetical protein
MSPTARTLTRLRRLGYIAGVVERFVAHPPPGHRRDFIGCVDVLGFKVGEPLLAVQATSIANTSARVKKAVALSSLAVWLAAGNRFEVWGWGQRGGKWVVKIVAVQGVDMRPIVVEKPRRRLPQAHQQRDLWDMALAAEITTADADIDQALGDN